MRSSRASWQRKGGIDMAISYVIDNVAGAGFLTAFNINAKTTPEIPRPPQLPGTHVFGMDGSVWVFCRVGTTGATITAGDFVLISTDDNWVATGITGAAAHAPLLGSPVGMAGATSVVSLGTDPNTNTVNYIWVQRAGYTAVSANVATGAAAFTQLNTNAANSGRLTATADTGVGAIVTGVVALATAASNTAFCFLNWPVVGANQ